MKSKLTIQSALSFTKLSVALMCCWPPSPKANQLKIRFFEITWWALFLNSILLFVPLLNGVYEYRGDPLILGKTVCLCCAVSQVILKMMFLKFHRAEFHAINSEMERFCKGAKTRERRTLESYVDQCKYTNATFTFWTYFTTISVITTPLYLPQTFPTHAVYPFSVNHQPLKTLIFVHQSLVGFQVSAAMTVDCYIAFLLWYAVARFELLVKKMNAINSEAELNRCIKLHNDLLRFTRKINSSVYLLILATVVSTTIGVVFGSLNLITNQPALVKMTYLVVVFSASIELFICSWPADSLMNMSAEVAWGAYNLKWFEKGRSIRKKLLFIIMRSGKPEMIHISSILPNLSLRFYTSFLYASASYFTTLKIMVASGKDV